jgi:hypothetical protein
MACHLRRCARGLIPSHRRDVDRSHQGEHICADADREAEPPRPLRPAPRSIRIRAQAGRDRCVRPGQDPPPQSSSRTVTWIDPLNPPASPTRNEDQYLRPTAHKDAAARPSDRPSCRGLDFDWYAGDQYCLCAAARSEECPGPTPPGGTLRAVESMAWWRTGPVPSGLHVVS